MLTCAPLLEEDDISPKQQIEFLIATLEVYNQY